MLRTSKILAVGLDSVRPCKYGRRGPARHMAAGNHRTEKQMDDYSFVPIDH